ncbi:F-box SKIP17 -like protein [Gossypium arboreum]|uniref:F-box SKIP17-like protein n=1 Tax=Gossypium arboreum TaxID=29729 RepID=A0A0B0NYW1_GOSAR|nr:F-box SKIP17 -like protein [Gossypium arboreum]KHG17074.1 F-box SKIP17 -like protein [Gossypium arboreum]
MDTLLHPSTSSMAKRPCPSSAENPMLPSSFSQMDNLLLSFLSLSDSSPPVSLDLSFDRLLESAPSDADQSLLIDRAHNLGSLLLRAANRSARKRASLHNSIAWALPPDLTIKVFSMLDSQSLCYAAATCSMFNKCAMDPLCYANIDLTTVVPKVNNAVVSTMIQRAGKSFRSLKLGIVPGPTSSPGSCQPLVYSIRNSVDVSSFSWNDKKTRQGKESSILTRSCLYPLSGDNGAAGTLLRRLHLYNIERMDNASFCVALAACPSLLDLEIVGLHVELRQTLISVSSNCHLIERLFFESSKTGRDDSLKSPTCVDLVNNCPNISSLSLRGFKLQDYKVRILVKVLGRVGLHKYLDFWSSGCCMPGRVGFRKLKYADFSTSYLISGTFLRNLGSGFGGNLLEVLILRDCMHLKEVEVARFLTAVLAGDFKFLRYLDISNREGLASEGDWYQRSYNSSIIPLKQVLEVRPNICLLAEFPSEGCYIDIDHMFDSDVNSEISLPSQLSSHTSDGSLLMSSSESSYNSDQGSGNEEYQVSGFVIYEESSDEVDFLVV